MSYCQQDTVKKSKAGQVTRTIDNIFLGLSMSPACPFKELLQKCLLLIFSAGKKIIQNPTNISILPIP